MSSEARRGSGEISINTDTPTPRQIVTYTVGQPDPLGGMYQIAQHFKVPFADLQRANPQMKKAEWKLWGGEVLVIPLRPGQPIPAPPKPIAAKGKAPAPPTVTQSSISTSSSVPNAPVPVTTPLIDFNHIDWDSVRSRADSVPPTIILNDIDYSRYLNSIDYYIAFHEVDWMSIDPQDLLAAYLAIVAAQIPYAQYFLEEVERVLAEYKLGQIFTREQLVALSRAINRPTMSIHGMMEHAAATRVNEALAAPSPKKLMPYWDPAAKVDYYAGPSIGAISEADFERDRANTYIDPAGNIMTRETYLSLTAIQGMRQAGPFASLSAVITLLNGGDSADVVNTLQSLESMDTLALGFAGIGMARMGKGNTARARGRRRTGPRPRARATNPPTRPVRQAPVFQPPSPRGPILRPADPTLPGQSVSWRGADGQTIVVSIIAPASPRQGLERGFFTGSTIGLPGWQRAHSQGAGWGVETAEGMLLAPPNVNLKLQNGGIESYVRQLQQQAMSEGFLLRVTTEVAAHRGTTQMKYAYYRIDKVSNSGIERLFEFSIDVPYSKSPDPPGTVTIAEGGQWDALR